MLALTIAGPVRTYFAQRTEMKQLAAAEAQLRSQIADLEQQKDKLDDPVYIAAQARERLGFVMPGEIPYQVQLPAGRGQAALPGTDAGAPRRRPAVVHVAVAHHRRCAARDSAAHRAPPPVAPAVPPPARHPVPRPVVDRQTWTPWRGSWAASRAASSRSPTAARTANPAW